MPPDPAGLKLSRRAVVAGALLATTHSLHALSQESRPMTAITIAARLGEARIPDTPLANAAIELMRAASPAFLCNHCLRTYVFGALAARRISYAAFDEEVAFCAAALHDLGLTPTHMSADRRFEIDSAEAARRFCETHHVAPERTERVWDAIALHSSSGIATAKGPEMALVHLGAGVDVFGRGIEDLPREAIEAALEAYPRLGFKAAFRALLIDYCRTKPAAQLFTWTDGLAREAGCTLHGAPLPTVSDLIAAASFPQ